MTLYELTKVLVTDEELTIVVIAEDNREFELEQINGGLYKGLENQVYYVDTDFSEEYDEESGLDEIVSYDILTTFDDLLEMEVVSIDIDSIFHTVKLR